MFLGKTIYLLNDQQNLSKMIYTFTFNEKFLPALKGNLTPDEAKIVYHFINSNFIKRDNFFLKTNLKRKQFFKFDCNGGNGPLVKNLLNKLNRKYQNFPDKLDTVDFIFSNEKEESDKSTISVKKIIDASDSLEEEIDDKCKPFWQQKSNKSDEENKEDLIILLKRIITHSDEIFIIDRHAPANILDAKKLYKQQNKIKYAQSYLNTFEFLNSIIKNANVKNRFYGGLLENKYKYYSDTQKSNGKIISPGINVDKILKESFQKFADSKTIVHIISKYEAYDNLQFYKRLIVGLIGNELFAMIRTEKGLNLIDENNMLQKSKRKFDFVRQEIALDDWQDWHLHVRYVEPKLKFVSI